MAAAFCSIHFEGNTTTAREEEFNQIWEIFVRKMKTAAVLGVASASLVLAGASGAAAADTPILSHNVITVPVNIPITACGITVNVLGSVDWGDVNQPLCTTELTQSDAEAEAEELPPVVPAPPVAPAPARFIQPHLAFPASGFLR
ncbi:chaplin [Streptomyces sp. NPDC093982]|uniref:chaplin n=1 Tax=Streptomyces sp. NPDC093982 TaxID=3155077 RepID=UPI00343FA555